MKYIYTTLTAALLASSLLTGCAGGDGTFPSLERRDVERISAPSAASPMPSAAPVLLPSTVDAATLSGLVQSAQNAQIRFITRWNADEAIIKAGRGSAIGSDSWAKAQITLAGLESARSDAMVALAELDALYAAARVDGRESTAIETARTEVATLIRQQDRVLAAFK